MGNMHLAIPNTGKKWKNKLKKRRREEAEWTGKPEMSKDRIPGSRQSKRGYTLAYSMLKTTENLQQFWVLSGEWLLISANPKTPAAGIL